MVALALGASRILREVLKSASTSTAAIATRESRTLFLHSVSRIKGQSAG